MPLTLIKTQETLAASLRDASNKLSGDPDAMQRYVQAAAQDMSRVRPRILSTPLTLVAHQTNYALPAEARRFHSASWVDTWLGYPAWDRPCGARLPQVVGIRHIAGGAAELALAPPPSYAFLAVTGALHNLMYYAEHVITDDEDECTIQDGDEQLLLARAQAEAMKELALRGVGKPVSLRNGSLGATPSNATPSALHKMLMKFFERAACRS